MDEALMKRVLPHSVEAEQSVIGSMLMDKDAIIAASEIITASDFYQQQYGVMFESMVELFNEGAPVDLITLQNRLKEKDVPPGGVYSPLNRAAYTLHCHYVMTLCPLLAAGCFVIMSGTVCAVLFSGCVPCPFACDILLP